jgi:hypothetical protein
LTTSISPLNPGGLLLITLALYLAGGTHGKREEWIGGFKKDGENFTTLDGLGKSSASTSLCLASRAPCHS